LPGGARTARAAGRARAGRARAPGLPRGTGPGARARAEDARDRRAARRALRGEVLPPRAPPEAPRLARLPLLDGQLAPAGRRSKRMRPFRTGRVPPSALAWVLPGRVVPAGGRAARWALREAPGRRACRTRCRASAGMPCAAASARPAARAARRGRAPATARRAGRRGARRRGPAGAPRARAGPEQGCASSEADASAARWRASRVRTLRKGPAKSSRVDAQVPWTRRRARGRRARVSDALDGAGDPRKLRVRVGLAFVRTLRPALYALLVASALLTFWAGS